MGPVRDHYGTSPGPLWDQSGTTMGPVRDHYGTSPEPLWDQSGTNFSLVVRLLPLIFNVKYVTEKPMAQTTLRVKNLAHTNVF